MKHFFKIHSIIAVTIIGIFLASHAAYAIESYNSDEHITFHITDFGINQLWTDKIKVGHPFLAEHNRLYPELNSTGRKGSQILIPMPNDKELKDLSETELSNNIAIDLINAVNRARKNGITNFEIQLVQNINTAGYPDSERQKMVKKFGAAAYLAIGRMVESKKNKSSSITIDLTLGSNGTVAFTENISSWNFFKEYISRVDFVDGRAFIDAVRETIQTLGAKKISISNTKGDWPGHSPISTILQNLATDITEPTVLFDNKILKPSIANYDTVKQLIREFPELTVIKLTPVDKSRHGVGAAHILRMVNINEKYTVERVLNIKGDVKAIPVKGIKTAREIRNYMVRATREEISRLRQTPNWWIYQNKSKSQTQFLAEAHALSSLKSNAKKVLVIGSGHGAELIYKNTVKELNLPNVYRIKTANSLHEIYKTVGKYNIDLIMGVKSDSMLVNLPGQRLLTTKDRAEGLAHTLKFTIDQLDTLKMLSKREEDLNKWLGRFDNFNNLYQAFEKDRLSWGNENFVLWKTKTVEVLFSIGADKGMQKAVDHILAKLNYSKVGSSFGVDKVVHSGFRSLRDGNFDIESIELALDGVVGMTTGYATLLLTGSSEIAKVAADTAMETAGLARKYTLSIFMWASGGMGTHLDEYYNKIMQCEKINVHVPTPIEYFGSDSDVYKALSKRHLKTLNGLAYNTERLRLIKNYANSPKIPSYETYVDTNSKNNHIENKRLNGSKKSIIFGDTPQAQKAYVETIKRVGEPNVKWVKSIPSNFDRQMVATSFGADTIRIFKHTRYREIIRGGIRQIIPNPELKISPPEKKTKNGKRNDIFPDTEEWVLGGGPPPPPPPSPAVDFGGVYIDPDPEYAGEVENGLVDKVLVNRPSNDSASWSVPLPEGIE